MQPLQQPSVSHNLTLQRAEEPCPSTACGQASITYTVLLACTKKVLVGYRLHTQLNLIC